MKAKRILALLVALFMVFQLMPSAFADGGDVEEPNDQTVGETTEDSAEEPEVPAEEPEVPAEETEEIPQRNAKSGTRTVTVGVIDFLISGNDSIGSTGWQVRYWGGEATDDADCRMISPETTYAKSVGSAFWNNEEKTFIVFTAEIPADATGFKVHNGGRWFGEDGSTAEHDCAYVFNYDGDRALYEKTPAFTITFLDADGETVLGTCTAALGKKPVYSGETPVKAPANGTTYVFSGWMPEIVPAKEDAFYTAQFDEVKTYAAKIGETGYETLQAALDAAYELSGDVTVTLTADTEGYAIVHQKAGLNLTVDGDGHTISGQIIIDGDGRSAGDETLTITNVRFTGERSSFVSSNDEDGAFILMPNTKTRGKAYYTNKNNCAHNVTVSGCSFTGASGESDITAVKIGSGAIAGNVTLDRLTGSGLDSLAQFFETTNASVTRCEITGCGNGVIIEKGSGRYVISGNTFTVGDTGYGVQVKRESAAEVVLSDNTITAGKVLELRSDASVYIQSGFYAGSIEKNSTSDFAMISISGGFFTAAPDPAYIAIGFYPIASGRTDAYIYTVGSNPVA